MTYMGQPYHPWWLDELADDITLDGAAMQGSAQGAEAVRSIVVDARTLYAGTPLAEYFITNES